MAIAAIGVFVYLVGLCVGSFLNVAVYRLPRGLSIARPKWSFCPSCGTTLKWYDNIPVLGWLMLRARCRYCHKPISAQYPLVEAVTGLAFVLVYYLLFAAHARHGLPSGAWPTDVPFLLAWLVLVAVLVACSAMDLILYMVDTRVTDAALLGGIVLYALWPRPEFFAARAATPAGAAAVIAFLVSGVMMWYSNRRAGTEEESPPEPPEENDKQAKPAAASWLGTVLAIVVFVGIAVWLLVASTGVGASLAAASEMLIPAALLAMLAAMILTGGQEREADEELAAAIEAEAAGARGTALRELLWLTPALLLAIGTYFLVRNVPAAGEFWQRLATWTPIGQFTPLGGATFAIHGAIVGAAAGWFVRILFTLTFGREAFGTGDIYILAAAGAVGGWDIALLGFLFSVPIALAGWILGLMLKRVGMIPFGPPLALGFLTALWLNNNAAERAGAIYAELMRQPYVLYMLCGMLPVAFVFAVAVAKLLRRLIEPEE